MKFYGRLTELALVVSVSLWFRVCNASLTLRRIASAQSRGARCLDGSDAAYYLYRNTASTRWIIHLESNPNVCFGPSLPFCGSIAATDSGSSVRWSCVLPEILASRFDDVARLVSSDSRRNPDFLDVNRVYIRSCSGDHFTGQRTETPYNGLYFGGHNVVVAVLQDLVNMHNLSTAEQVLFGGASVGAVTHIDFLRSLIPDVTAVAGYTDGLGIRQYPTFTDLLPAINTSLASGNTNFVSNLSPLEAIGLGGIMNTFRLMDAFVPESCRLAFNGTAFGGMECFDVTIGTKLAVRSNAAVFVFGSAWDTLLLAGFLDLLPFTCASETGRLTEAEQQYIRAFGLANHEAIRDLRQNTTSRTVSVYFANCYASTFLEDDLQCTLVSGVSPYTAMVTFISEALQGRSTFLADSPPSDTRGLQCSPNCGAVQCTWATNPFRDDVATNGCTRVDGFTRTSIRVGQPCPGEIYPSAAAASTATSTMSRYDVINATARHALCLDSSPGAYYIHRNLSSPYWVLHLQGGTFCTTANDCQRLQATSMGSSRNWQCSVPNVDNDLTYASLSRPVQGDAATNPTFHTWNRVYVRYCSGDLFLGRQPAASSPIGQNSLGNYILLAILEDLIRYHGLLGGSAIVLGGVASGGVAASVHVNGVLDMLTQARAGIGRGPPRVLGYSDGGWLRFTPDVDELSANSNSFAMPTNSNFLLGFNSVLRNIYNSVQDVACERNRSVSYPTFSGHDCVYASVLWPFIRVPMFMASARYDLFDIFLHFGLRPFVCANTLQQVMPAQRAFIAAVAAHSQQRLSTFQRSNDGLFYPTCYANSHFDHMTELGRFPPCDEINGVSAYNALSSWVADLLDDGMTSTVHTYLGSQPPSPIQCAGNCGATQCSWASNPDNTNNACSDLTGGQLANFGRYFLGTPCTDTTPTNPTPTSTTPTSPMPTSTQPTNLTPTSTTPTTQPGGSSCPAADMATTDTARYNAYLECWIKVFADYQRTFNAYVNNQCSSP